MIGTSGDDTFIVENSDDEVIEAVGGGIDTVYAKVGYTLAPGEEIEILRAYPRILNLALGGNEFNNVLLGSGGDDTLDGGAGDDQLYGKAGNDTLNGGEGDDRLDGEAGADVMSGGNGDDIYYVDDAGDQVLEAVGGGTDTVYTSVNFTLAAGQEVEFVRIRRGASGLTLGGNELDNTLLGGSGDDTLNGGGGNDTLIGGDGNDTISSAGQSAIIKGGNGDDTIFLDGPSTSTGTVNGGAGNDTVHSTDLGQFVFGNVETLDTYYGFIGGSVAQFASFDAFTAVLAPLDMQISFSLRGLGGTLDFTAGITGQNSVEIRDAGLKSAIRITGSTNADLMFGSTYGDTLNGGNGQDTLFGNEGADTLNGGAANDFLNGGTGNDTLTGGGGSDTFAFDTPFSGGDNIDLVADFTSGADVFQLDPTYYFQGLSLGQLSASQFSVGSATGSVAQIVYNQATGALFYDFNGSETGGASQFATVAGAPVLTSADFRVVESV